MRRVALALPSFAVVALLACSSESAPTEVHADAITIQQLAETLEVGQADSLSAALQSGGASLVGVDGVRWVSSDTLAFSIDSASGVGRAKAVGAPTTITVTATYGQLRASAPVVVLPDVVGLTVVMSASVALGHTVTPVAAVLGAPAYGVYTEVSDNWGLRFESSDPGVLRVNQDGTVTAVASGTASVSAIVHGRRASKEIVVGGGYALTLLPGTELYRVVDVNDAGDVLVTKGYTGDTAILVRGAQQVSLGHCEPRQLNNREQVLCGNSLHDTNGITDMFATAEQRGTPTGVNEHGEVFGLLSSPDSLRGRSFVWRSGSIESGTPLADGVRLQTTGHVNLADFGLGQSSEVFSVPVVLREAGYTYLAPLAGRYATAYDINEAGNVVGASQDTRGSGEAAIWLKAESWNGVIIGPRTYFASAISERDEVVGLGADGVFVWKYDTYVVLADVVAESGWTFNDTPSISRDGIIAAAGVNTDGRRGVVLVKLP